jgi:hypothetical protein
MDMRKPGLILLIIALAAAAFWLGTRYRPSTPAAGAPDPVVDAAREADVSSRRNRNPREPTGGRTAART